MRYLINSVVVPLILLLASVGVAAPKEISVDDALQTDFSKSKVCDTSYHVFITFKGASGYAEWQPTRLGTARRADETIAETQEACEAAEKPIKAALNALKAKWIAKCVAEVCVPSANGNTGADDTNCDGGEVTVTNRKDHDLKCTYPVKDGKTDPKTLNDGKKDEKCWNGDGGHSRGYSSVLAYVPPKGETPKLFMNLDCRSKGNISVLDIYKTEDDIELPEEGPKKDEPPKDEPPKDEPPKDDPPKDDPPKDDPPKDEPPKDGG